MAIDKTIIYEPYIPCTYSTKEELIKKRLERLEWIDEETVETLG